VRCCGDIVIHINADRMEASMNNTSAANEASRIVVAAQEAMSIEMPAGAAIQCVAGKLWLTQEGDARDHVVPAGTTFCTDRPGRVVVSAIDVESAVLVRKIAPRHCTPGAVTIDSIERFTHAARAAQAEYVAGLFVSMFEWLRGLVTRNSVRPERSGSAVEGRTGGFRGYVRSL
jgi:hypothetical protein